MFQGRGRSAVARWLKPGVRVVVALLMVIVLPSRPAMGCWFDAPSYVSASEVAEEPADDCCDEASPDDEQSNHDAQCPCPEECPPGCTMGCGLIAALSNVQPALAATVARRAQIQDLPGQPAPGVGLDILHVPK